MKIKLLVVLSLLGTASLTPTAANAREIGASDPTNWCYVVINWHVVARPCR
jgi:hypothetical protein